MICVRTVVVYLVLAQLQKFQLMLKQYLLLLNNLEVLNSVYNLIRDLKVLNCVYNQIANVCHARLGNIHMIFVQDDCIIEQRYIEQNSQQRCSDKFYHAPQVRISNSSKRSMKCNEDCTIKKNAESFQKLCNKGFVWKLLFSTL